MAGAADNARMESPVADMEVRNELSVMALLDRILVVLPEAATESERLGTTEFRKQLQEYREQIHAHKPLEPIARKILELCQDYFRRAKVYRNERESGYVETIEVLREAVAKLAGDSRDFNAQLVSSSKRFQKLAEVDDINEIRNRISEEVENLSRTIEEKQKHEEEHMAELSARVEVLQAKLNRAKDEASIDALTRLANRRAFDRTLARWVADHNQNGSVFVLAIADIDDFKQINDSHGHPVGDRVLMGTAQLLAGAIQQTEFVARYGGEEFAILLSETRLANAEVRMQQFIKSIAAYRFRFEEGTLQFTLSCGIADFIAGDTTQTLVERADKALYDAKRKGKNRVVARKKSRLTSIFD